MDHSNMDHSHMGHGDMDMGDQCNMNMLFTWSSENLCIVFRQWRITGTFSLIISLAAIVLLSAGYEGIRDLSRRYEQSFDRRMSAFGTSSPNNSASEPTNERSHLLPGLNSRSSTEQRGMIVRAFFYAIQVFYSFFIMLLFMTYNGWVMLAVAVGAFLGYLTFGRNLPSSKSASCH